MRNGDMISENQAYIFLKNNEQNPPIPKKHNPMTLFLEDY